LNKNFPRTCLSHSEAAWYIRTN